MPLPSFWRNEPLSARPSLLLSPLPQTGTRIQSRTGSFVQPIFASGDPDIELWCLTIFHGLTSRSKITGETGHKKYHHGSYASRPANEAHFQNG